MTRPAMRRAVALALACVTSSLLAACSPATEAGAPETTAAPASPTAAVADDGVLRIGVLLPLTGPGAELGAAMRDAVDLAIDQVNETGGIRGVEVERVTVDEGADADSAARALNELLGRRVDAIVGPASSSVAARILSAARDAGVLTCSPTASALSLDGFPDGDLFVRTIPSDSLQAAAIARLVEQSGEQRVNLLYLDDAFGRPFAEAVRSRLADAAAEVVAFIPFTEGDADYSDEAAAAVAAEARATVVIGDSTAGPRMVDALFDDGGLVGDVFVNDAMRVPATPSVYARMGPSALRRLHGVSPASTAKDPAFVEAYAARTGAAPGLFAGNAFDCVSLIALSALTTGSTVGAVLATAVEDVSHLGTECTGFADCRAALGAERNIDLDGTSGELQVGRNGDLQRGLFDVFVFDNDGRDRTSETDPPLLVSR